MGTSVKGFFKGLRYITQIFDEEKEQGMQIGFPTDVKHVAHIGSDGPQYSNTPSWMNDFKSQEMENGQVVTRGDVSNNPPGEGVGLQELLPPTEKPKQKKARRKPEAAVSQNGSPPRRHSNVSSADMIPRPSRRHHRSRHGSLDSSNDPSVRRKRVVSVTNETTEGSSNSCDLSDVSAQRRKSTTRHRKPKGSGASGEVSMRKSKAKSENSSVKSVDKTNDNNNNDKD